MIYLPVSLWAWAPLGLAALMSLLAASFAWAKPASVTSPRVIYRRFFEGPGLTNSGTVATFLSMLPILLSSEVREDIASASLLGAATLLFSLTTLLGLWLYSTVAARKVRKGQTLQLTSNHLIAVQGVIISCMMVAVGCFIAFILITPLLGARPSPAPTPSAVHLKCDRRGCTLEPSPKG